MNYAPLFFLAAFFAVSASWFGFVLTPQIQIGRQQPGTNIVNTAEMYPQSRPGLAREGLEVYRANGCVYCHSQQVGQTATEVNVILSSVGTNAAAVADALLKANVGITNANAAGLSAGLPRKILHRVPINTANAAAKAANGAGADAKVEIVPLGPDIARGWGNRRTIAQDFLYDETAMPGSLRVGPDLANVGSRLPDANWHLLHLYNPQMVTGSPMPAYRFLFKKQKKVNGRTSPDALQLPAELAPKDDYEIVPLPEAKALVAYLLSLHAATPLFETPLTMAAANATNAPAASTGTNSPAK